MKDHFKLLFYGENRRLTLFFIGIAIIAIAVSLIIGVADNPPGIILLYIGFVLIVISLVHTWRKIKPFLILLIVSIIGALFFAVLHNVFYGISELTSDINILPEILSFFDAMSFLIALIICPSGFIVGLGGTLMLFIKRKKTGANLSS